MAKRRVVVLHFVAQMPMAGIAWQALHYLVALEQLGYEAWYIENHGANPYDPRANSVMMDCAYNVGFLKESLERFGFAGRWAYWDAINDVYHGMERERVFELLKGADALINLCGATRLRDEHMGCPVRIMVDTDPVYEQIKYAKADPAARAYLDAHTHFFTYGENVGGPGWIVPLCGVQWKPTRPQVVLELWPEAPGEPACFSTIATWENKGKDIEFEGERYVWSKHFNSLPRRPIPTPAAPCFTRARAPPPPAGAARVTGAGWILTDPRPVSAGIDAYGDFIRGSRGEFTVAKDIYVRPKSGWFSDRSVCYLASGRPVVTLATEFSRFIPVGEGVLHYADKAGALEAIAAVNADYPRHARAARRVAAEFFAGNRVVGAMMREAGL